MLGFAFGIGILLYWASVMMAPHGSQDVMPLMLRMFPWMLLMLPIIGFFSFLQVAVMEPPPGETRLGRIFKFWITVAYLTDNVITFFYVAGGGLDTPPRGVARVAQPVSDASFGSGLVIGLLVIAVFVALGVYGFAKGAASDLRSIGRGVRRWRQP